MYLPLSLLGHGLLERERVMGPLTRCMHVFFRCESGFKFNYFFSLAILKNPVRERNQLEIILLQALGFSTQKMQHDVIWIWRKYCQWIMNPIIRMGGVQIYLGILQPPFNLLYRRFSSTIKIRSSWDQFNYPEMAGMEASLKQVFHQQRSGMFTAKTK